MGKIIGIDLGTTNSCVAVVEAGEPKVIVNEEGARTTPSVVAFNENETLVGITARRQAVVNPKSTVYSVKRFIGSKYSEVKGAAEKVSYEVKPSSKGDVRVQIEDKSYSPPEISAKVLQKLKRAAEKYLGETVTEAVITVPAYFNDSQRQATKDAGKIAGLDVKRIINEPTSAALAYGLNSDSEQLVAVYDFGGGTFDVSVLEVSGEVVEVLSTSGDTYLGGDNVDECLVEYMLEDFKTTTGLDVSGDPMVLQRVREAAEKAKVELSSAMQSEINLPFLTADATGPKHMACTLTRAKFEQLIGHLIEKTFDSCSTALKDAGKLASEIDQIILVGGSTRIPLVGKKVQEFFGKDPNRSVNPDEVVALGAAVQGGVLSGDVKDVLLLDVTPLSLGIETQGSIMTKLIEKNTTIPYKKSEIFSTAADNQPSVDIHVLQGEREMAGGNRSLGKFSLSGIPAAPRGIPQIEVTFDIDANGILKVSAKDMATGKDQSVTITDSSGLSENEIQQMIKDASKFEAEDQRLKELAVSKNSLDNCIYTAKAFLRPGEIGDKLLDSDKEALQGAVKQAESFLESTIKEDIDSAVSNLNDVLQNMTKTVYEQHGSEQGTSSSVPNPADDDIVDAEFA